MSKELLTLKYAPKSIDEVILSPENAKTFTGDFDLKSSPNLLFLGRSGTGKTTLAKIIAAPYDYLYINASDASGVDTIRNQVSDFVKTASIFGELKVVILDEADGLSAVGAGNGSSAQQALRSLIEENLEHCRFILTANYEHKIIEPLQSRCQTHYFNITKRDCAQRIYQISQKEGIEVEKSDLAKLVNRFYPDIRKCIHEFSKGSMDGKFTPTFQGTEKDVASTVKKLLDSKANVFDIRAAVINEEDSFAGNYLLVMRGLFDLYCQDKNIDAVRSCCYHMEKDPVVMDKEVNFTHLLTKLI